MSMDRIAVRGGGPLQGEIDISGAKNAALPLMIASLLTEEILTLRNVPADLRDTLILSELLAQHGTDISVEGTFPDERVMHLKTADLASTTAPYELVRQMRASFLVLGPLLARAGHAKVPLPGGDAIGIRPVDLHTAGLEAMGAVIELADGFVSARAPQGLKGAQVVFPKVSVGATEHLMMTAALAKGETQLINAAREPEVSDLAQCLVAMGAKIDGIGTERLVIQGQSRLIGADHRVIADRIESGTYLMAVGLTGGELLLNRARLDHLEAVVKVLRKAGLEITALDQGLRVSASGERPIGTDVMTESFPGFPTDLQAQFMALMTVCDGAAMVTETIFENRFMHAPELMRLGANISTHQSSALIRGVGGLTGAPVVATDLRASVSLVLAGLIARGETVVDHVYHLDRGYEKLAQKLARCGANIERLDG